MKRKDIVRFIFGFSILSLVVLCACNDFQAPPTMWSPNKSYPAASSITGVTPANTAIAGVREISITGHFTSDITQTWIWFGSEQAAIKRMSATADTMVLYRPIISGTVTLKSINLQADSVTSTLSYNLESPVRTSDISGLQPALSSLTAWEANRNGTSLGDTLWLGTLNYITMLLPDGVTFVVYKNSTYFPQKVNNKATDYYNKSFLDMKFGPGGCLYATFNNNTSLTIYKIDTTQAAPVAYAKCAVKPTIFDFNSNGDIYFNATLKGLYLFKNGAATSVAVGDYAGLTFNGLRVYNGYVYVATSKNIFRSIINADGTVGTRDPNPVVNVAADSSLSAATISSFSIGADGTILVSLGGASSSLYVLQNGSLSPYYYNNILPAGIGGLVWGTGRYLYLQSASKVYQMGVANGSNAALNGAPYPGRSL